MAQVKTAITASTQQHPAGTTLGKYRIGVVNAAGFPVTSQQITLPLPAEVALSLSPGDYSVTAQQLDAQGLGIGAAYTESLNVPAPLPVVGPLITDLTFTVV